MPAASSTFCPLRTSVIPLRYPFRGSGHPVEVVERRCGRDRRYRHSDRPLSRFSISTRRAWTIRLKLHANAFR